MKRFYSMALTAVLGVFMAILLSGCGGPTKLLHCDRCGKELRIPESSNMTEDWIIYCSDCEKELGLDKIIE